MKKLLVLLLGLALVFSLAACGAAEEEAPAEEAPAEEAQTEEDSAEEISGENAELQTNTEEPLDEAPFGRIEVAKMYSDRPSPQGMTKK